MPRGVSRRLRDVQPRRGYIARLLAFGIQDSTGDAELLPLGHAAVSASADVFVIAVRAGAY
jgi:hypothetical protein